MVGVAGGVQTSAPVDSPAAGVVADGDGEVSATDEDEVGEVDEAGRAARGGDERQPEEERGEDRTGRHGVIVAGRSFEAPESYVNSDA